MLSAADIFARTPLPAVPFELRLADGEVLTVDAVLRLLPGRRLTARVSRSGGPQLLKLFARPRERSRELRGLRALADAAIPGPCLLGTSRQAVFTSWIDDARTLADCLRQSASTAEKQVLLAQALAAFGCLQAARLHHMDPHLENFLRTPDGVLHLVDAGAIRRRAWWQARDGGRALFCAQLPLAEREPLWRALGEEAVPLRAAIARADRLRARRFAAKSLRECSEFTARRNWSERRVLRRDSDGPELQAILADPDRAMRSARLLKDGNSATVVRLGCAGRDLVLKRYNIKGPRHAVLRAVQTTRAARSWRNAALLQALGIATPPAVALLERRSGPLRSTAYLLMEAVDGATLADVAADEVALPRAGRDLRLLFDALGVLCCSHGDCKASNFVYDGERLWTLDLDGMRGHWLGACLRRALARDRARLRDNFDAATAQRLDSFLEPESRTS